MRTNPIYAEPSAGPTRAEIRIPAQSLLSRLRPAERAALPQAAGATTASTGTTFALFEHVGADRARAEQFISRRFDESFSARVEAFMPRLFGMYDPEGNMRGALGLRSARHRLFVEHYLDQPIEQAIAQRTACTVDRASIVEVGHLSGTFPGAMRTMIWLLTERLHREGFEWVAFTGTTTLRNAFRRNGLLPIDIESATIEKLPREARAAWGSYYDHGPRVFVGRIRDGVQRMLQAVKRARADFGQPA